MEILIIGGVGVVAFLGGLVADRRGAKIALCSAGAAALVLALIVVALQHFAAQDRDEQWSVERTSELASLANASEVKGESSAFVTRISEENVLRYVSAHPDGSYALEELPADGVLIREDADDASARIDFEKCLKVGVDEESPFASCGERTVVHIPKGSIVRDFDINPGKS